MNNAKEIAHTQQKGQKNYGPDYRKNRLTMIGIIVAAVLFIAMCVVIFYEAFHKEPVVTVDGDKYYVSDVEVMYNVYVEEAEVEQIAQQYTALYNGVTESSTYWNMGSTKEIAKEEALENIIRYELMYREAVKNNISLTEEETNQYTEEYATIFENMNSDRVARTGFEKESFVEYALKVKLAEKYMDQLKESYGITADTLATTINKEDYEERKIDTIYVPLATSNEDDDAVAISDEQKAEYKAQIEAYLEEAKAGKEFSEILPEGETTFRIMEGLSYTLNNTTVPSELIEGSKNLKAGEITEAVIEGENYYFIAKMLDTNSDTAYQQAIADQIEKEQQEKLDDYIETLKEEYKVTLGDGWNEVEMGSTAVLIGEDISEFPSAAVTEE